MKITHIQNSMHVINSPYRYQGPTASPSGGKKIQYANIIKVNKIVMWMA